MPLTDFMLVYSLLCLASFLLLVTTLRYVMVFGPMHYRTIDWIMVSVLSSLPPICAIVIITLIAIKLLPYKFTRYLIKDIKHARFMFTK